MWVNGHQYSSSRSIWNRTKGALTVLWTNDCTKRTWAGFIVTVATKYITDFMAGRRQSRFVGRGTVTVECESNTKYFYWELDCLNEAKSFPMREMLAEVTPTPQTNKVQVPFVGISKFNMIDRQHPRIPIAILHSSGLSIRNIR